jgi:hypothetical protein
MQFPLAIFAIIILPCDADDANKWSDNFSNKRTDYVVGILHKTKVKIPPPKGFIEASDFEYIKLMKSISNSSQKNHIGAFVREVEVPALIKNEADLKLKIYGSAFSIKRFDHIDTTPEMMKSEKQAITEQSKQYKTAFSDMKKALMGKMQTKLELIDDKDLLKLDSLDFKQKILPVHDESIAHFSYSTYQVSKIGSIKVISTQTMTMVAVKKKLIFLTISGDEKDLEETRRVSRLWVRDVLNLNKVQ